jgi:RAB protein geranylgeranyltransferase component A
LAGALAKSGKKLIHIDNNDYYGGNDASLNMREFVKFMQADDPIFHNKQFEMKEEIEEKLYRQFSIDL